MLAAANDRLQYGVVFSFSIELKSKLPNRLNPCGLYRSSPAERLWYAVLPERIGFLSSNLAMKISGEFFMAAG